MLIDLIKNIGKESNSLEDVESGLVLRSRVFTRLLIAEEPWALHSPIWKGRKVCK